MVYENHRKSRIQHCERSELRLHKLIKNTKNSQFWRVFRNLKLPRNSVTRQITYKRTKIGGKYQNVKSSNATF